MSSEHQHPSDEPASEPTDVPVNDNPARVGDGDRRDAARGKAVGKDAPKEIGGRAGLDPTRYGDWEKNGRCIDF